MSQNLVSLSISPEKLAAIAAHLAGLEQELAGLIELSVEERRTLTKMGDKSEVFCRQTLLVLDQNRQIIPPEIGLDEALDDQRALDALRPVFERLRRLTARADDTEMALGSDMLTTALEGYGVARVLGKGAGLDALRETMSVRLGRRRKTTEAATGR